jgi:hypothetical protein
MRDGGLWDDVDAGQDRPASLGLIHEERIDVIHTIKTGINTAQRLTLPELLVLAVVVGLIVAICIPAYQSLA